ncbi:unnamed protein product [Arabis nemorensis]|uniref:Uncharacterized protein n=1 Tax=Arabis nemorensis TaxID=586526 RepID=A0A565BCP7_9BRAS|nr:unnamed protein product [Arabis nemorensis]
MLPQWYSSLVKKDSLLLYMSLFTVSIVTGGIGLVQLSNKFRMEIKHALFTLFFTWLFCPLGIFAALHGEDKQGLTHFLCVLYILLCVGIVSCNLYENLDSLVHPI